jgi:lipopolysaccharide transport system permease protein
MTVDVAPFPRAGGRRSDGLEELWRYRELFYFLAWRDVKIRYKQTALGVGWAILQPLLTMMVFTLLFGRLGNMPSDGIPYPVFYFAALLPWTYFATTLANAGNSLVLNANLLTKVYFPRIILPSAAAVSGLVDLAVGSILLGGLMAYYGLAPTWKLLLLVPLTGLLFFVTLAVGMVLAALNVKYRDVKYTLPFLTQFWLFVTPVIYPVSLVPERYRLFVALNPLSGVINGFRASLVPTAEVYWPLVGASTLVTAVLLILAVRYFVNTERSFADIV